MCAQRHMSCCTGDCSQCLVSRLCVNWSIVLQTLPESNVAKPRRVEAAQRLHRVECRRGAKYRSLFPALCRDQATSLPL